MARTFTAYDDLLAAVGEQLGHGDWLLIDQARIDSFDEATGDDQWIHVDPERAAAGPFGTTIAHGYLTLALVPALVGSLVDYAGWPVKVNYGSNKVRFPAAVPVGARVRAGLQVAAGVQVAMTVTVEIEGPDGARRDKPALVAETLTVLVS